MVGLSGGLEDIGFAIASDSFGRAVLAGQAGDLLGVVRLQGSGTRPTPSATLVNISTCLRVEGGDNVLIGGFIVTGIGPKKVLLRAIGPSLPVDGKLADPTLELVGPGGTIVSNDEWRKGGQEAEIIASTVPPTNDKESALVLTLPGNAGTTAVIRGQNGSTGVALVEIFALD